MMHGQDNIKSLLCLHEKNFLRETPEFHIIVKQHSLFYFRMKYFLYEANKGKGKI